MLPLLTKLKRVALDFFYPQNCLGCGKEGSLICHACHHQLIPIVNPICPLCGRPFSSPILCPACTMWKASIDCIRSPLRFEGLARQAIHQLKYKNLRSLAPELASLMVDYLLREPLPVEVVMPVPLHPRRLKERGYNQSSLLAAQISRHMNLPLQEGELRRIKYLIPQARTTSVKERRENVKDAFACSALSNSGRAVLLIDDVATSGATLDACAQALKKAGSGPVYGFVLAREI